MSFRGVASPSIFTGGQVKAYCNKMLNDTDKFLNAADAAARQGSAAPLEKFFGAKRWNDEQAQTMFVLCTTFRRFAIAQGDEARRLVMIIRDNNVKRPDNDYVMW